MSVSNNNILSYFSRTAAGILLGKCGSPLSAACSEVKILYRKFFFFCPKTCFLSLCTHHNCPDRMQTPEMPPEEKQNLISKNTHSLRRRWCTFSEKVDSPWKAFVFRPESFVEINSGERAGGRRWRSAGGRGEPALNPGTGADTRGPDPTLGRLSLLM